MFYYRYLIIENKYMYFDMIVPCFAWWVDSSVFSLESSKSNIEEVAYYK